MADQQSQDKLSQHHVLDVVLQIHQCTEKEWEADQRYT